MLEACTRCDQCHAAVVGLGVVWQYTIWAHLHRLEGDKAEVAAAAGRALLWKMHISHLHCGHATCLREVDLRKQHHQLQPSFLLVQLYCEWYRPESLPALDVLSECKKEAQQQPSKSLDNF